MRNRPRLRQERWKVTCGLVLIYTLVHHVASNGGTSRIPDNSNLVSSGEKTTEGSVSFSVENTATHPTIPAQHARVPSLHPRRQNCTPPAIEQFPMPLMGPEARKSGGLILHILVAVYTFLGLAIVCDDYFVSSLDRICEGSRNYKKMLLCCSHRKKKVPWMVEMTVLKASHFLPANILLSNPLSIMSASLKSMLTSRGYHVFITTNIHMNRMAG